MAIADAAELVALNPATGREIGRITATHPSAVAERVAHARRAQARWADASPAERRRAIHRFWRIICRDAEALADLLCVEVGKPRSEAMIEVVATLDALRWTVRHARRVLAGERIGPAWQRWLLVPAARLQWRPFGVVGILGTWNYPLLLNAPALAQALVAGNGVVWKPSERAALVGERLQRAIEDAGVPAGLVAAVQGGPEVGQALVSSAIDKCVFTGGVENGRLVLSALGSRGIPAVAELSGFDAAVVLPDAPPESTRDALTWAAFVGAGQTCVAVKRVYVVGRALPWAEAIAARARALRVGDPTGEVDVGPLISERARDRFLDSIHAAVKAGGRLLAGGHERPGPGWFVEPAVLVAERAEVESALEGVFGPVVLVRGVPNVESAIDAVNANSHGLSASVWSRDRRIARGVADRLQVGMVSINDAVAPSAHAAAPFGGVKASGFGRTRGALGLQEMAQPQVVFGRGAGGFRPHLFPYSDRIGKLLSIYRRLFHGSSE
jgi:acyl-CoA reductase-like NAD-dependent aldehyde dehydrogenase